MNKKELREKNRRAQKAFKERKAEAGMVLKWVPLKLWEDFMKALGKE